MENRICQVEKTPHFRGKNGKPAKAAARATHEEIANPFE
jgi:hypothetical protein